MDTQLSRREWYMALKLDMSKTYDRLNGIFYNV